MPSRTTNAAEIERTAFEEAVRARLRMLRENKGASQGDVAEALGVDANTYSKYESRSLPPHWLLPRLAAYYSVTCDFLLTGQMFTLVPAAPETGAEGAPKQGRPFPKVAIRR